MGHGLAQLTREIMKKLAFLILVFSTTAIAAPSNPPIFILGQTVAKLPSAAAGKNQFWTVTDGATASDCSTGMGTYGVMCWSNGTTWTAVGGGSSSGVTGITEGTNITCTPITSGSTCTGNVTINASSAYPVLTSPGQYTYTFWVTGPLLLSQTSGSGYSGTGSCTLSGGVLVSGSADTCTATQSGGAITFAIVGTGIYSAWPQVTLGGVTGGSGAYAQAYNDPANTTIYARQEATGTITTGTDAAIFLTAIFATQAGTGGSFFFKNGIYPINSYAAETTSGWTSYYYGIAIPAGNFGDSQQWIFHGETRPEWNWENYGLSAIPIQVNGVIFASSAAAESGISSSDMIMNWWQRPNGVSTSNEVKFNNMSCRFSQTSRGNQTCWAMWMTSAPEYNNVEAGIQTPMTSITVAPVAGSLGSFGMTGSYGSSGLPQFFHDIFIFGYDIGADWNEHTISDGTADITLTNHPFEIGRGGPNSSAGGYGPVYHGNYIARLQDQENKGGGIIGPEMQTGSRIDMPLYDVELAGPGSWFSGRTDGNLVETNAGASVGNIDWTIIKWSVGVISANLFASGGSGFCINGTGNCGNGTAGYAADNFTRANNANLGPNWTAFAEGQTLGISSNQAVVSGAGAGTSYYSATIFSPNQCSTAVINGSGSAFWGPIVRATPGDNYYGANILLSGNSESIYKTVAGSQTVLASGSTSYTLPATVMLCANGSVLTEFVNGVLKVTVSDSTFTTGAPGLNGYLTSGYATSWLGQSSGAAFNTIPTALTFTTATSDSATIAGVNANSHCTFSPTNSTAAATTTLGYVSAVSAGSVTISHAATVASGGTVNIICTSN